jgi:hypothetical protein
MLIDQDRVAVRIDQRDVGRAGGGPFGLGGECQAGGFELGFNLPHIVECGERFALAIPAGVERETVLFEHALEETDRGLTVAEYEPVLLHVSAHGGETKFLVEGERGVDVFDGETDRESSKFHNREGRVVWVVVAKFCFKPKPHPTGLRP